MLHYTKIFVINKLQRLYPKIRRTMTGQCVQFLVTVETLITQHPPHSSRRAELPHRALQIHSLPYSSKGKIFNTHLNVWAFSYSRLYQSVVSHLFIELFIVKAFPLTSSVKPFVQYLSRLFYEMYLCFYYC